MKKQFKTDSAFKESEADEFDRPIMNHQFLLVSAIERYPA